MSFSCRIEDSLKELLHNCLIFFLNDCPPLEKFTQITIVNMYFKFKLQKTNKEAPNAKSLIKLSAL